MQPSWSYQSQKLLQFQTMTQIHSGQLDLLLYHSEGPGIDFKRTEYPFSNASDEDKSELLKDILAMANAWRSDTGYILIGFVENRPHPAEVLGISQLMDDAAVQQFVNEKSLNRKLDFSYQVLEYKGKTVAVISIPKQERPFYLVKKGYGKLKPGVVYVRRGSSTAEADPTELAKMGADDVSPKQVLMTIDYVGMEGEPIESNQSLTHLNFGDIKRFPDYSSRSGSSAIESMIATDRDNHDYWRGLAHFFHVASSHFRLRLRIKNTSGFSLTDLKVDIQALDANEAPLPLRDSIDWPDAPKRRVDLYNLNAFSSAKVASGGTSVDVEETPRGHLAECKVEKIRPGQVVVTEDFFALTAPTSGVATLRAVVYGNELGRPTVFEHQISLSITTIHRTLEDLKVAVSGKGAAFLISDEASVPPPAPLKLQPKDGT